MAMQHTAKPETGSDPGYRKQAWGIVGGTIGLACVLGICIDLVTANVAVEYFSVHHPPVVDSENPWVLAVVWGIGASWWFGAIAGVVLAWINTRRQTPLDSRRILRWVAIACIVLWLVTMAILTGVFAIAGAVAVENRRPTFDHDRRLVAVAVAHQWEYLWGAVALLAVAVKTWRAQEKADVDR